MIKKLYIRHTVAPLIISTLFIYLTSSDMVTLPTTTSHSPSTVHLFVQEAVRIDEPIAEVDTMLSVEDPVTEPMPLPPESLAEPLPTQLVSAPQIIITDTAVSAVVPPQAPDDVVPTDTTDTHATIPDDSAITDVTDLTDPSEPYPSDDEPLASFPEEPEAVEPPDRPILLTRVETLIRFGTDLLTRLFS